MLQMIYMLLVFLTDNIIHSVVNTVYLWSIFLFLTEYLFTFYACADIFTKLSHGRWSLQERNYWVTVCCIYYFVLILEVPF